MVRISLGTRYLDGRSETISTTGLSIDIKEAVAEGTAVVARFPLPVSSTIVSVPAVAMWTTENRSGGFVLGLRFNVVSFEVQREIEQFVEAFGETLPEP